MMLRRRLVAAITSNYERDPVFHLCRNCPDLGRIDAAEIWSGEDDRRLCDTCHNLIADDNCIAIPRRRRP